jgi:glycosyltransferase involved in cell wall biosynthesis
MTTIVPWPGRHHASRTSGYRPDLAIVVSTFERPMHLRRCLESIAAQTDVSERIEVVVTDDGSRDLTLHAVMAFARKVPFRVAVTTHAHDGFRLAQCRNEGVAASQANRLLFTDGDCLLPPGTLSAFITAIRPGRIAGGDSCRLGEAETAAISMDDIRAGRFTAAVPGVERRRLALKARHAKVYELLRLPMRPRVYGNAIGIARSDYERLNGFDEAFVGWGLEDRDLQLRAEKIGIRVKGMFEHAFVHQWHTVDPSWVRNAVGTENDRYFHRRDVPPECRTGYVQRATETIVAFDSRPMIVQLPTAGRCRRAA